VPRWTSGSVDVSRRMTRRKAGTWSLPVGLVLLAVGTSANIAWARDLGFALALVSAVADPALGRGLRYVGPKVGIIGRSEG
jgi:hypothetical protein